MMMITEAAGYFITIHDDIPTFLVMTPKVFLFVCLVGWFFFFFFHHDSVTEPCAGGKKAVNCYSCSIIFTVIFLWTILNNLC